MLRRLLPLLPARLQHAVIRRGFRYDEAELEGVEVHVAATVEEYLEAARLLYGGYVARGLIHPHGAGVRFTPYLALPSTVVFVARRHGLVVGTLSLVLDSRIHLPMDKVFSAELQALRDAGRRPAEVGALCVDPTVRGLGIPFLLYKAMWLTSRVLPVDDLVVAVVPEAAANYQALLLFQQVGPARSYPGIRKKTVALRLPLPEAPAAFRAAFGHLPKDQRNPHYLYTELTHPQLQVPTAPGFMAGLRQVRMQASVKLAALRPDTILDLAPEDFEALQREFD